MEKTERICKCGNKHMSKRHNTCKTCENKLQVALDRTVNGKLKRIYNTQIAKSRKRGHDLPSYTRLELLNRYKNDPIYLCLHNKWVCSGYDRLEAPSLDRLDDYKPYSFDNIRMVSFRENSEKHYNDKKNGINNKNSMSIKTLCLNTNLEVIYYSMSSAGRELGISLSKVSELCKTGKEFNKKRFYKIL